MSTLRRKTAVLIATLAIGGSLAASSVAPGFAWADELAPNDAAPLTENGTDAEIPDNDVPVDDSEDTKQGWQEEDGAKRYYDKDGSLHKGWLLLDGTWYWLDEATGNMQTGWQYVRGSWYWMDKETGAMATSRTNCDGRWSDFADSGAWRGYANGWDYRDGTWYWLENSGQRASGWRLVKGSWYWMDTNGAMRTGWLELNGTRYHLSDSGAMNKGWLLDNNSWYWLDPTNGDMRTGWQYVNGRWYWADTKTGVCAQNETKKIGSALYAFGSSCAMGQSGWALADGTWYWAGGSGSLEGGWHYVSGGWYWMDPETKAMATGLLDVNGTKYYMNASGAMATGWAYDSTGSCWYYAANSSSDGHLLTGWQLVGGKWYWMDGTTYKMQTGWLTVGGKTYHLSDSGAMDSSRWIDEEDGSSSYVGSDGAVTARIKDDVVTMADGSTPADGLAQIGNTWFYVKNGKVQHGAIEIDGVTHLFDEKTGRAVTGWHAGEDGVRHHYDAKGVMQTDCWVLDGSWYLLDENGVVKTGWQKVGGSYYYLELETGAMKTGWFKDGDSWYWLDKSSGAMATGWVWDGGAWYYMNGSGVMQTGWIQLGSYWYWLDKSSGAMGTGWVWDGGAWYFCASDGHWVDSSAQYRDMFNKAQNYSSATGYLVLVDTNNCRLGVYTGRYGAWTPVKEIVCSTGADSTPTIKGQFTVQDKGYSFGENHGYSCYYWTRFCSGYLFHSIKYYAGTRNVMDGRLGEHVSAGCVRLAIENAEWIYRNVPAGTKVVVW